MDCYSQPCRRVAMALYQGFNVVKKVTKNAMNMLLDSPGQHASLVAYAKYSLPVKHKYCRPSFLELDDESTLASADHEIRPILIPKHTLLMNAGYAEVINAGKTKTTNEDQSVVCSFVVTIPVDRRQEGCTREQSMIPCVYFAVFDGHAGCGAALFAANKLQYHVKDKLTEVAHMLVLCEEEMATSHLKTGLITSIDAEMLIIGALEQAFVSLDQDLKQERYDYRIEGGCTALVGLFILGKLYVANAGDCRAVLYDHYRPVPMSFDHTPETERKRIARLASVKPELLCGEYTRLQFQHRARKKEIGTKQLYRDYHMDGWALKTVTKADILPQLISGEGKRARLLDTIGTTRGFGDHDLEVPYNANIKIKPFMSAEPVVKVFDLSNKQWDTDDVLVMASDGLWERCSNIRVGQILHDKLRSLSASEQHRYTVAAQSLIAEARGSLGNHGWRMSSNESASYDDISVFVIPMCTWKSTVDDFTDRIKKSRAESLVRLRDGSDEFVNVPEEVKPQPKEFVSQTPELSEAYESTNNISISTHVIKVVHDTEEEMQNGDLE